MKQPIRYIPKPKLDSLLVLQFQGTGESIIDIEKAFNVEVFIIDEHHILIRGSDNKELEVSFTDYVCKREDNGKILVLTKNELDKKYISL